MWNAMKMETASNGDVVFLCSLKLAAAAAVMEKKVSKRNQQQTISGRSYARSANLINGSCWQARLASELFVLFKEIPSEKNLTFYSFPNIHFRWWWWCRWSATDDYWLTNYWNFVSNLLRIFQLRLKIDVRVAAARFQCWEAQGVREMRRVIV